MQKLSFKYGAKTRTLNLPIDRPENIFVEFANGDEVAVQKIYSVGGRGACIKILIDELPENPEDLEELSELRDKVDELRSENNGLESDIEYLKSQLGI
jgi:hypothetical protein